MGNTCKPMAVSFQCMTKFTTKKKKKTVNSKGNQYWIFIWRTEAEAEAPILRLPDAKSWLIGKDPDAGKDWRREKKGTTEDEMVGWHHRLNGREFEQEAGVGEGQRSLECCSPWGHKELDMTKGLNWLTESCWRPPKKPKTLQKFQSCLLPFVAR